MITQKDSTTYIVNDLGDVKTKIVIGGTDPSKFVPNINMSFGFGGNEEFFININNGNKIITSQPATLSSDKISQTVGNETDEFYVDEKQRLNYDIVYSYKPSNMIVELNIDGSNGLEFLHQDSLEDDYNNKINLRGEKTLAEYLSTRNRPDEVVGGYYIYCSKINNKYKTGQIAFIPRPFVKDALGKMSWCTQIFKNNKWTITMPSDFWDTAVLPVRLGPSIGYTTVPGTSEATTSFAMVALKYNGVMPEDGNASKMYIYAHGDWNAAARTRLGYYDEVGGYPTNRLDGNKEITIIDAAPAWYSADVSGALSNGAQYFPTAMVNAMSSAHVTSYYNSGSSGDYMWIICADSDMDNPFGAGTWDAARYGLYLEYTTTITYNDPTGFSFFFGQGR